MTYYTMRQFTWNRLGVNKTKAMHLGDKENTGKKRGEMEVDILTTPCWVIWVSPDEMITNYNK